MGNPIQRRAAEQPDEIALADGRVRWGWRQVDERCNRTANAVDQMDLGSARRMAVFAENSAETCLAYVGGLLGGASTVPVNFHLTASELEYILRDSGARALLVGPETMETGLRAARAAGVSTVIGWRCPPADGLLDWAKWLDEADPAAPRPDIVPRPNLLYTSGTSGLPKGAETPPTMFPAVSTVAEHVEQLGTVNRLAKFGRHLVVSPMYHSGPLAGARILVTGCPITVLGRFDAEATLAAIEADRVETTIMVPTHFIRLLALPEGARRRYDLSSLRYVPHTGSKCPEWVKRAMIDWWGPVFWDRYGATEVGATNEISSEEWLARPGSVGRCISPFEAVVLDAQGQPVPPMTEGRLFFEDSTGRGIVYHNDPAKSAAAHIAPGVFTLGDMGYVDADGYVFITDRASDMVISGGVNIYPAETEHVLIEHPDVADVACIGVPDDEMGEVLKALVVPADPANPPDGAALIAWCRGRIAHYKCPRSVDMVTTIGRTAMGKVDKRALRQGYWLPAGTATGLGAPSTSAIRRQRQEANGNERRVGLRGTLDTEMAPNGRPGRQGPPMSGSSRAGVRTGTVSAAVAGAERNGGPTAGLQAMVGDRKVVRAGISYYGEGVRSWPDRVHRHPEPELFLCLQGSGRFETPDGALEVRPGDFLVVDGDVEHHQVGGTGGLCMSWWILELEQP